MTRKYHNHKLQSNPRNREEELHNPTSTKTVGRQLKQQALFLTNVIAKLETHLALHIKTKKNTHRTPTNNGSNKKQ